MPEAVTSQKNNLVQYFIFGGSGFIGSHLTRLIKESAPSAVVFNLDLVEETHGGKAIYVKTDVREAIALPVNITPSKDDAVINLAAIHRTPGHPDFSYFETNIRGAENVTKFAEQYGILRLAFTSSIAPYGASEEEKYEETLPTPNTPYGISKLVAEHIHLEWQRADQQRQLTIVRPGVVFGLGEHGNFTRLYWSIRRHRFAFPGRRDTIKACIYVKDLANFLLYRIEKHGTGAELYNCTYEPAYTIGHIVDRMKAVTGLKSWTPLVPRWVIMPAAYIAMLFGSPMGICPARVRKLMISTNICGRKMAQSGYTMHYTLDEALDDWLKDSGGDGMK